MGQAETESSIAGGDDLPEIPLPAAPFDHETPERLAGSAVRIRFCGGETLKGYLLDLDLELARVRVRQKTGSRTFGFSEIDHLLFSTPLKPVPAEQANRAVEFRVELADADKLHGHTLGSVRTQHGLNLFVRHEGHFHRMFIPAASIAGEQVGERLGEVLVHRKAITRGELDAALDGQGGGVRSTFHRGRGRLGERLRRDGNLSDEALAEALASKLGLAFVSGEDLEPEDEAVERIPANVALENVALPLAIRDGHLRIAVADPTDSEALSALQFVAGMRLDIVVASDSELRARLHDLHRSDEQQAAMEQLGVEPETATEEPDEEARRESARRLAGQKPIVRLVAQMIGDAIARRASDIHLRPEEDRVHLLYRIDGMLVPIQKLSKPLLAAIVSRIKIIGKMDIAEHRVPQDGRTEFRLGDQRVDLRISIIPTVDGESVVIRLLDTEAGIRSLDQLGLTEKDTELLTDLVSRSHGMLLVTGPTGSGKSTTLYAALGKVRERGVNIITVEDPVEYHVADIQQIQVSRTAGLTFARALRNILRHDPDVVMVGEIRDQETANIAMESALTGHLVLSTLHTNSAAGTITRLLEMGIKDYLIASTLLGVLAQRLVRRNCKHCLDEERVSGHVRALMKVGDDETFMRGRGCRQCNDSGYAGRMVAYELMPITEHVRKGVHAEADESELRKLARDAGMVPLNEHALSLARQHLTSLDEAYRLRTE
ncbi:MAG: ATPase, T2SS/T4P/T4SS family [Halofilum sp. (in: g-proteobacteria)]|nr:ATPase, T2SS/T4P/T4SS family [Halofilum sp. (in: g-proteobacteria)]